MTQPSIHDEKRAERIAAIRELADWLTANPDVPMPSYKFDVQVHLQNTPTPRADGTEAENLDRVRKLAGVLGIETDENLDDRTVARIPFGGYVSYEVFAWHKSGRDGSELERLRARVAELESSAVGLTYSRVDDDPNVVRPHSPRVPLHTGAVVDGGELVDETPVEDERCPACGESLREIALGTLGHIPGEACAPASGLTPAADLSRGPLAGTTPVVAYFSFGHGQTDPDTGKNLLDHYVTVVAPTYEECREAMFASRFGNRWAWDYLAGRAKTTEWVSRWTEYEVIVAAGTDQELAKSALKAAGDLLYGPVVDPTGRGRESDPDWVAGFGPVPGSDLVGGF